VSDLFALRPNEKDLERLEITASQILCRNNPWILLISEREEREREERERER
jgi:hypothetical protein